MADVKAIIQDCSVGFSILPESGCSVSGALMPEAVVRHHSSAAGVAAAILSVALAISVVDLPTSSPRGIFIQSISEAEAYIFVSAGDTLIETKINKSAEKLTPTAHSRAWKINTSL